MIWYGMVSSYHSSDQIKSDHMCTVGYRPISVNEHLLMFRIMHVQSIMCGPALSWRPCHGISIGYFGYSPHSSWWHRLETPATQKVGKATSWWTAIASLKACSKRPSRADGRKSFSCRPNHLILLYSGHIFSVREEDFEAPLPHRHQEVQGCISDNVIQWSNGCAVLILKPSCNYCKSKRGACLSREICVNLSRLSPMYILQRQAIANGGLCLADQAYQRSQIVMPASQLYSQAIKYLACRHTFHWEMHNRPNGPLILCSPARTYQLCMYVYICIILCKQVTCWPSDLLSLVRGEQHMEPVLAPEDHQQTENARHSGGCV